MFFQSLIVVVPLLDFVDNRIEWRSHRPTLERRTRVAQDGEGDSCGNAVSGRLVEARLGEESP